MSHTSCQVLFEAGQALVAKSGLAKYSGAYFVACDDEAGFDEYWKREFHPEFGRYMAWVLFSVGAENLAKAACVCNGVVKARDKPTLEQYLRTHFKKLYNLPGICDAHDERSLVEGYECLREVRNRDAHSYRRDVRSADFSLVAHTFVPAFNVVLETMKNGGHHS